MTYFQKKNVGGSITTMISNQDSVAIMFSLNKLIDLGVGSQEIENVTFFVRVKRILRYLIQ